MIKLVAFQGPSGSGKSTLQKQLGVPKIVSYTTRNIRPGEINGEDYYFTTESELLKMKEDGQLLEISFYKGNWYATPLLPITTLGDKTHSIIVDYNGLKVLRKVLGDKLLSIGVYAAKIDCKSRLSIRGKNTYDRLISYEEEVAQLYQCDLIINNSDFNRNRAIQIIEMIKDAINKGMNPFA